MKTVITVLALLMASGCVTTELAQKSEWGNLVYTQQVATTAPQGTLAFLNAQ